MRALQPRLGRPREEGAGRSPDHLPQLQEPVLEQTPKARQEGRLVPRGTHYVGGAVSFNQGSPGCLPHLPPTVRSEPYPLGREQGFRPVSLVGVSVRDP